MGRKQHTEAIRVEAVSQVTDAGHGIYNVASRPRIRNESLYDWSKAYGPESGAIQARRADQEERRKLKAELKWVTQERDILKEATRHFAQESKCGTGSLSLDNRSIPSQRCAAFSCPSFARYR